MSDGLSAQFLFEEKRNEGCFYVKPRREQFYSLAEQPHEWILLKHGQKGPPFELSHEYSLGFCAFLDMADISSFHRNKSCLTRLLPSY